MIRNRRLIAILASLVCLVFSGCVQVQVRDRPDILFIAIDDLNDWIGHLEGHPQVKTPNIDRLAAQGISFTNAYTNAPSCNPARTSLMSGQLPSTTGVYGNYPDWREVDELKGVNMLPAHFRKNGYRSVGGGKVFHAHTYFPRGNSGHNDPDSWDEFYPSLDIQLPDEIKPPFIPANGNNGDLRKFIGFDWAGLVAEDDAMADGQVINWAERELESGHNGLPRFMAVGIYRPHLPWYVPQKYIDMYPLDTIILPEVPEDDLEDIPEPYRSVGVSQGHLTHQWVVENDKWKQGVQAYLASISFADAMVGRVLDALEKSGRADNTIVVLFSDHGFQLGHKHRWRKYALWRQSSRIPLIIVAPGITAPGITSQLPVSLVDLYPTLIKLAGLPTPDHILEGNDLRPLLENPNANWDKVAITTYGFMNHAVQDERYRYIRYSGGGEELYDHEKDPQEWTNLADSNEHAPIVQRLSSQLPEKNEPGLCPEPMGLGTNNHPACRPRR